jgi:integrase
LVFPSERGTPIHAGNYLRRTLKGISKRLNVPGLAFQALRRTCSTHILRVASVKDSQRLLRHESPVTTLRHYAKSIPQSLSAAVEAFAAEVTGGKGGAVLGADGRKM